ncbi:hypothetical protein GC177_09625 [bacterium]|nr:hypothetical protein [bacterium]
MSDRHIWDSCDGLPYREQLESFWRYARRHEGPRPLINDQSVGLSMDEVLFEQYWQVFALNHFYALLADKGRVDMDSLPNFNVSVSDVWLMRVFDGDDRSRSSAPKEGAYRDHDVPLWEAMIAAGTDDEKTEALIRGKDDGAFGAIFMHPSLPIMQQLDGIMETVAQEWWITEGEQLVR